jgi:DNA-binding transcriptional MerR regulator
MTSKATNAKALFSLVLFSLFNFSLLAEDPFCSQTDFERYVRDANMNNVIFVIEKCPNVNLTTLQTSLRGGIYGVVTEAVRLRSGRRIFDALLANPNFDWNAPVTTIRGEELDAITYLIKEGRQSWAIEIIEKTSSFDPNKAMANLLSKRNINEELFEAFYNHPNFDPSLRIVKRSGVTLSILEATIDIGKYDYTDRMIAHPKGSFESAFNFSCVRRRRDYFFTLLQREPSTINTPCVTTDNHGNQKASHPLRSFLSSTEYIDQVNWMLSRPNVNFGAPETSLELFSWVLVYTRNFDSHDRSEEIKKIFNDLIEHPTFNPLETGYEDEPNKNLFHILADSNGKQPEFVVDKVFNISNLNITAELSDGRTPFLIMIDSWKEGTNKEVLFNRFATHPEVNLEKLHPQIELNSGRDIYTDVTPLLYAVIINRPTAFKSILTLLKGRLILGDYDQKAGTEDCPIFKFPRIAHALKDTALWQQFMDLPDFDINASYSSGSTVKTMSSAVAGGNSSSTARQASNYLTMATMIFKRHSYNKDHARAFFKTVSVQIEFSGAGCPAETLTYKWEHKELFNYIIENKESSRDFGGACSARTSRGTRTYGDNLIKSIINKGDVESFKKVQKYHSHLIKGPGLLDLAARSSVEISKLLLDSGYTYDSSGNQRFLSSIVRNPSMADARKYFDILMATERINTNDTVTSLLRSGELGRNPFTSDLLNHESVTLYTFTRRTDDTLKDLSVFENIILPAIKFKEDEDQGKFFNLIVTMMRRNEPISDRLILKTMNKAGFDKYFLKKNDINSRDWRRNDTFEFNVNLLSYAIMKERKHLINALAKDGKFKSAKDLLHPFIAYMFRGELSGGFEDVDFHILKTLVSTGLFNPSSLPKVGEQTYAEFIKDFRGSDAWNKFSPLFHLKDSDLNPQTIVDAFSFLYEYTKGRNENDYRNRWNEDDKLDLDRFFAHKSNKKLSRWSSIIHLLNKRQIRSHQGDALNFIMLRWGKYFDYTVKDNQDQTLFDVVLAGFPLETIKMLISLNKFQFNGKLKVLTDRFQESPEELITSLEKLKSDFSQDEYRSLMVLFWTDSDWDDFDQTIKDYINSKIATYEDISSVGRFNFESLLREGTPTNLERFLNEDEVFKSSVQRLLSFIGGAKRQSRKDLYPRLMTYLKALDSKEERYSLYLGRDRYFSSLAGEILDVESPEISMAAFNAGIDFSNITPKSHERRVVHPVHVALATKQFEVAKKIAAQGNALEVMFPNRLKNKYALPYFIENEAEIEILNFLVEQGVDINKGYPLAFAIKKKNVSFATYLLSRVDIDPNAYAANYREVSTPLIEAVNTGDIDLVKLVLNHPQTDKEVRVEGRSAAEWAITLGHTDIWELLK